MSALYAVVRTMMKSLSNAFLRTYPSHEADHNCNSELTHNTSEIP